MLNELPANEIEAAEFARKIRAIKQKGGIRGIESMPVGGTPIALGDSQVGEMMDVPLPVSSGDPWSISRIRDFSLAQVAFALTKGKIWLHRNSKPSKRIDICPLKNFADKGAGSRNINGMNGDRPRGPFVIHEISKVETVQTYPCLWAHNCENERRMTVSHDSYGEVRPGMEERANEIFEKSKSKVHYNADFRFNSQSLAAAFTDIPVIGGQAWPSIIISGHPAREMAYVLWSNSTLGILLYWWYANKQQPGRGRISPIRILEVPTLDLRSLSESQLSAAKEGFKSIQSKKFLSFHLAYECPVRKELDEIILADVLGFPQSILKGVAEILKRLCYEPSVQGGKKSRQAGMIIP